MSETRVIRDKAFAKRIEIACENHPLSPSGHGRQTWLRRAIEEKFGVKLSPEAVRKWFAGEARPRPKVMSQIAQVLQVDEAWLSLGLKPTATPVETQKRNALVNGAVNLVAGQIQLAGGSIAFSEEGSDHEMFAIVRGKQHAVTVRLGNVESRFKLSVPVSVSTAIAVVPTVQPTVYRFFRVPAELIDEHGDNRGGYTEIELTRDGDLSYAIAGTPLPEIANFNDLDGTIPSKKVDGIRDGIAPVRRAGVRAKTRA
jgi:transcriptional regulator with XRE-family HTH domain